jgi:hypothetical protein
MTLGEDSRLIRVIRVIRATLALSPLLPPSLFELPREFYSPY